MKVIAKAGDTVVAESENTILIEGNHYFPPEDVKKEFMQDSDMSTTCHWKGNASYKTVVVGDDKWINGAFYYADPLPNSKNIVGRDYTGYYSFWQGVTTEEV